MAPTTLLARQHYKGFAERFRGFPINLRRPLSRFVNAPRMQRATRDGIAKGTVDIVIGTHARAGQGGDGSRTLGLLDDRRGAAFRRRQHKERLKQMRTDVHVLTLTATPIPRTLQLSPVWRAGTVSIIGTPPIDRLSIRTYVSEFDAITRA
jgi:transcription-repair coupling factor (superfamily II helicase)